MPSNCGLILLFGNNSEFAEHIADQVSSLGFQLMQVFSQDELLRAIRDLRPSLILVHWNSLGEAALRFCSFLKSSLLRRAAPIALVREDQGCHSFLTGALASGADDVIDNAEEPHHLRQRLSALLLVLPPSEQRKEVIFASRVSP